MQADQYSAGRNVFAEAARRGKEKMKSFFVSERGERYSKEDRKKVKIEDSKRDENEQLKKDDERKKDKEKEKEKEREFPKSKRKINLSPIPEAPPPPDFQEWMRKLSPAPSPATPRERGKRVSRILINSDSPTPPPPPEMKSWLKKVGSPIKWHGSAEKIQERKCEKRQEKTPREDNDGRSDRSTFSAFGSLISGMAKKLTWSSKSSKDKDDEKAGEKEKSTPRGDKEPVLVDHKDAAVSAMSNSTPLPDHSTPFDDNSSTLSLGVGDKALSISNSATLMREVSRSSLDNKSASSSPSLSRRYTLFSRSFC